MFDISTVGAEFTLIGMDGRRIAKVNQFSEEGTPFECNDVDLSTNEKNLNGEMISSRTPSVYTVSITVIPGSDDDIELTAYAQKCALFKGNVQPIRSIAIKSATLAVPYYNESSETGATSRLYTFTNGRMKSAPTGASTSAEGRQSSRTFTFEFEQFTFSPIGASGGSSRSAVSIP